MSYLLVHDLKQVEQFCQLFIPNEKKLAIVFVLFARKKYDPSLPKPEYLLGRTIISGETSASVATREIQKMQIPLGLYTGDNDYPIPNDALCLYCLIRPKDMVRALMKTVSTCVTSLNDGTKLGNPLSMFKRDIGTSNANVDSKLTQIDLDSKDPTILQEVKELFAKVHISPLLTIETRGGYHIIYEKTSQIDHKTLWEYTSKHIREGIANDGKKYTDKIFSITNEPNVIVPGTIQGRFQARIVNIF